MNKPKISVAFVQDMHHICYFLQKEKLAFRFLLSESHYFSGDRYFQDLLTPVTFYHYLRRFATFEGHYFRNFTVIQIMCKTMIQKYIGILQALNNNSCKLK